MLCTTALLLFCSLGLVTLINVNVWMFEVLDSEERAMNEVS